MSRFVRDENVISQASGEATVLFHMETGRYFSLNETGSRVWALCDGTMTAGEIATRMAEEFDASPYVLQDDISELLQQLAGQGLVRTASGEL
jgi:hypothetical protein